MTALPKCLAAAALFTIVGALALAQVPAGAEVKSKRISLTAENAPLSGILEQFRQQSNIQITLQDIPPEKTISLQLQNKPFWEALRELITQSGATSVNLVDVPAGNYPFRLASTFSSDGPYLVAIPRILRAVHYDKDREIETLQLSMNVITDTSLRITQLPQKPVPAKAIDERGNSLVPREPAPESSTLFSTVSGLSAFPIMMTLDAPPKNPQATRKIALLEGSINATVILQDELEVAFEKTVEREQGGMRISIFCGPTPPPDAPATVLAPAQPGPPVIFAGIHYRRDGALPDAEWRTLRVGFQQATIRVLDAQGRSWQNSARAAPVSSPDEGWIIHRFLGAPREPFGAAGGAPQAVGDAVKAVVNLPTRSQNVQIPYRFENLIIP